MLLRASEAARRQSSPTAKRPANKNNGLQPELLWLQPAGGHPAQSTRRGHIQVWRTGETARNEIDKGPIQPRSVRSIKQQGAPALHVPCPPSRCMSSSGCSRAPPPRSVRSRASVSDVSDVPNSDVEQQRPRRLREPREWPLSRSCREREKAAAREKAGLWAESKYPRWWQKALIGILFIFGPLGTVVSFQAGSLPKGSEPAEQPEDSPASHESDKLSRIIHIALAHTERRSRFVLDEVTDWEDFLGGARDRLGVKAIRKVTDSGGEAIFSTSDIVHGDRLVIYAADAPADAPTDAPADAPAAAATAAAAGGGRREHREQPREQSAWAANAGTSLDVEPVRPAPRLMRGPRDAAADGGDGGSGGAGPAAGSAATAGRPDTTEDPAERFASALHASRGRKKRGYRRGSAPLSHLLTELKRYGTANATACGKRHPRYRVAMLIPWAGGGKGKGLPSWLPYFLATARGTAYLVDWVIFHEALSPPRGAPPNVRFVDLGQGGLAQLMGLRMGEELDMPVRNASLLIRSLRFMLEKWPRLVAEYKPAFGSIFQQYLSAGAEDGAAYTHWGYCDVRTSWRARFHVCGLGEHGDEHGDEDTEMSIHMHEDTHEFGAGGRRSAGHSSQVDMVLGNLPLFMEQEELESQDIVSYSFGDQDALYLRGQWTLHRNVPPLATVWKRCPHLGHGLQRELLMKVAWVRRMESRAVTNYPKRFQSAEGCYSHRAFQLAGVRIKMAHKQFVGLSVPAEERVFVVGGAVWQCPKSEPAPNIEELREHAQFQCDPELPGVQTPLGERLPLQVSADGGCGKWMPREYRMCALNLPEPPERERDTVGFNTILVDGKFYAQRFRSTLPVLNSGCRQGAFFHMQEWKKMWGFGTRGVDPLELAFATEVPPDFELTTEGITLLS